MDDLEKQILGAAKQAISKAVGDAMTAYGSPLITLGREVVAKHAESFRSLIESCILNALNDPDFKSELRVAMREKVARELIQQMGGDIHKRVAELKSNPVTRARITQAIDAAVQ